VSSAHAGVAAAEWDFALQRMGGHFLQSTLWQRVQTALGHDVIWARDEQWMWAGAIRAGRFPRYVYLPHGPTASTTDAMTTALGRSVEAARERSLDFVRAEPAGDPALPALIAAGANPGRAIQPRWTWILDLTPDEAELRRGLSAGHRGAINAAPRRGLSFRRSNDPEDIEVFLALQERTAAAGRFRGQAHAYHRAVARTLMPENAAELYIAEADGAPVAAALCFDFAGTRYYAHAVSDPDRPQAPGGRAIGVADAPRRTRDGREAFRLLGHQPRRSEGFRRCSPSVGRVLAVQARIWRRGG
jgi:hypothetical protein